MSKENEQEQDFEAQEESTDTEETTEDESTDDSKEEETVTLSKKEFKAIDRKARAYDATKKDNLATERSEKKTESSDQESIIKTVSALRGLEDDEIEKLETEATTLGVNLLSYIKSDSGKTYLKKIRDIKKSKDAEVDATSKSTVFKKFSQEDLNKMSSKELEKILPRA